MEDFISRSEARSLNLKFYFIGEECSNGHISDRFVSTNKCVECVEDQNNKNRFDWEDRASDKADKIERAKKALTYIRETLIDLDESERTGLLTNFTFGTEDLDVLPRSRTIAKSLNEPFYDTKLPCKNNHLSIRETETGHCIACVKQNKEDYKPWTKIYSQLRRKRIEEAEGFFTNSDIQVMYYNQKGKCVYCSSLFEDTGYHIDHIHPLCLGGSHWPYNLQLLCPTCNKKKSGKHPDEYEKQIGYIRDV